MSIRRLSLPVALVAATVAAAAGATPPPHPDELRHPELRYEPPRAAQYRVTLKNGIAAYLVPDRALPLVTVSVLLRVGPDLDPPGQEGLAQAVMHLLTRSGTATRSARQLEDRLAFLGAQLTSALGSGGGGFLGGGVPIGPAESHVTLNLLAKDLDEGLQILTECLRAPGFEPERAQLARDQLLQAMRRRNDDSADLESREWSFLLRGEDHWTNRHPTQASVESVTREDMERFVRRYVGPRNFVLAVSGDFERAAMVRKLEAAFAGWPTPGERPPAPAPPRAAPRAGWFFVGKEVNQGRVALGLAGLDRFDPDYQSARVMNDILGGGGFTSRLVNRIRSDEGLAYSVGSALGAGTYYPDPWRVGFQSKVRSVAYAIDLALAEIGRMRDSLVTDEELRLSKSKFIEGLPASFPSAEAIAGALAAEELTGRYARDPNYFAEVRERIARVTAADVQRVARRLLDPARLTVLMVGDIDEMLAADPKYPSRIPDLAGGEPPRLPLRDPMTLRPLGAP